MLDAHVIEQLKSVFSQIENKITLLYDESSHPNQTELLEMLKDVASTSSLLELKSSQRQKEFPQFTILKQDQPTSVFFKGIPGGHEFTSLVVAILNTDGKGKFPEKSLIDRIQNLKGPIHLKTYISLSCDNCPEVVQALNQMALLHPDFKHEMIDGAYVQDEISSLGIQGVPSVVHQSQLIHSGKVLLLDLLALLEKKFGMIEKNSQAKEQDLGKYDVLIIGGGPAGVSAAIYSARKGLRTALLAERIGGQVQDTKGIENLISVPYTEGPQLSAQLQQHLHAYPIQILDQRRVKEIEKSKKIHLENGDFLTAESIIVATGAKWRELGVPGEKEYLGRGVAYCPHCDGPFYKGKTVAVFGGGNSGVEAAIDLAGIVKNVVLFEFQDRLKADQVLIDKLKSLSNVSIITHALTKQILGNGQKVVSIEYEDRTSGKILKTDLDGVFIQIGLIPNTSFLKGIVDLTKFGEIIVDEKGRTNVPGIYAAGDVTTTPYKQIIIAMGDGAKTALAAFEDRMYHH